jgi:hypothetical protein
VAVAGFLGLIGAGAAPSLAIPAFARKYQTSCQTCHVAFPMLTPFGEAFRLNGYRFPEGTDPDMVKVAPVELGAEGYKKMWPKAVWPGEIPGLIPVSLFAESEIVNSRGDDLTSFDGVGGAIEIQAGGTLGENFSFFGNLVFDRSEGETSTELERFVLLVRPFRSPAFQFKLGAFDPGLLLISSHRSLITTEPFILTEPVGDNGWAVEPDQQGIEFFGVAGHRFLYDAGLVEGSGNVTNNRKDYYGRVAYKFGGLALDCFTKGGMDHDEAVTKPKPWSEKSVTLSAFIYKGSPLLNQTTTDFQTDPGCTTLPCPIVPVDTTLSQEDKFQMYGGDLAWNFLDLIVHAGGATRTDRMPYLADPTDTDVKTDNIFGEILWVAYPWLVPSVRWESFSVAGDKGERVTLDLDFLIRANVKAWVAVDCLKAEGSNYNTDEIAGGVAFGF